MMSLRTFLAAIFFSCLTCSSFAAKVKAVYCDTSAGRLVLNNGNFSKYYCRYNAIMDYQTSHGCCSWSGGIFLIKNGNVICRDGSISPVCSLQGNKDSAFYVDQSDGTVKVDSDGAE